MQRLTPFPACQRNGSEYAVNCFAQVQRTKKEKNGQITECKRLPREIAVKARLAAVRMLSCLLRNLETL